MKRKLKDPQQAAALAKQLMSLYIAYDNDPDYILDLQEAMKAVYDKRIGIKPEKEGDT